MKNQMNFDGLKPYYEQCGYEATVDGHHPFRRIRVSKGHYGGEYYEDDWSQMDKSEKKKELEELTTTIEQIAMN